MTLTKKPKLIFFDIDGTILEEGTGVILPSTIRAIRKARENGHYAMINTGRTNYLVTKEIRETIGFDGYLCGCGTNIWFQGKELLHKSCSKELADHVKDALYRYKIDAGLEGKCGVFFDKMENVHTEIFREFIRGLKTYECKYWGVPEFSMDKFYGYAGENSDMPAFQKEFGDVFDFIDREKGFWEVVPKGYSKASGMEYMMNYLNIAKEDTVAIGDSNNDIPMLEYAGCSIAMGNSSQTVLEMADYVTTDVSQDGIENALSWLGVL